MENHGNTSLPPEIMIEIFLLLPLESILTCKLVSKEWNDLVKNPMFIKLYNIESTTFFVTGNKLNCLFRKDDNDSYKVRRLPLKLNRYGNDFKDQHELLVESSNKIACVKTANGHFLLYNLFTGDLHVVADAPFRKYPYRYGLCYGFGYDCYDDDYKILVVCQCTWYFSLHEGTRFDLSTYFNKYNKNSSLMFVYSHRNRDWKLLEGFPRDAYYWPIFKNQGPFYSFKGVLHWLVTKRSAQVFQRKKVIVALDIHSYGLVEILLPPIYYNDSIWKRPELFENLTELDGNLCCSYTLGTFDVWVMKEYGVPESWTKLFSIRISGIISNPLYDMQCTALYQCKDHARGIVVFLCQNSNMELFRYDIDKDVIQVFSRQKRNNRMLLQRLKTRFKKACTLFAWG